MRRTSSGLPDSPYRSWTPKLVDEVLAPDWENNPLALNVSAGSEGFKETIAFLRHVFPDITITIEDVVVSGDRAAVRTIARGTHKAEMMGIPATGRQVEFNASDIHRVEGGRIVQSWHLEDYVGLFSQLGATFSAAS
ncbi:ester cyclase [Streptomyces sp. NPDC006660]|uniref:ester cyclase n=1 Tax=Streptomyces sp. NPDC006660 TaxID=3156901 RepID=UPI0033CCB890